MKKDNKNMPNGIERIKKRECSKNMINNNCLDMNGVITTSFLVVSFAVFFSFVIYIIYKSEYSITKTKGA